MGLVTWSPDAELPVSLMKAAAELWLGSPVPSEAISVHSGVAVSKIPVTFHRIKGLRELFVKRIMNYK